MRTRWLLEVDRLLERRDADAAWKILMTMDDLVDGGTMRELHHMRQVWRAAEPAARYPWLLRADRLLERGDFEALWKALMELAHLVPYATLKELHGLRGRRMSL